MELDSLSPSKLNTYQVCPMRYYFRYCEGEIVKPTAALTLGIAAHTSIEGNYRQKVESHEDLPLQDVLDAFSTEFDDRAVETEWFNDDPGQVKDAGVSVVGEYQSVLAPEVQPVEVEMLFTLTFKNRDWNLRGRIDVITDKKLIRETKTTRKSPGKAPRPDHLLQCYAYSAGYSTMKDDAGIGVRIDYCVAKKAPCILSFPVEVGQTDVDYFLSTLTRVADAIEKEIWIPNRSSFLCTKRYCGYHSLCVAALGGRVKD